MNDYTKHSVTTDALDTLGTIIGPGEKRDAIHLAVYPVEAAHRLRPGEQVALDENGRAVIMLEPGQGLGIVDPFLTKVVQPGKWFWLVVYPRQISSLRHVWEHPDFPPSNETKDTTSTETKEEAELWLRNWFYRNPDNPGFDAVMSVIKTGSWLYNDSTYGKMSDWGTYIHFCGTDAHGDIPDEFWDHVDVYLGLTIPNSERAKGFSCSC